MLSDDIRFEGFDREGWLRLLSLVSSDERLRNTLVVIEEQGRVVGAVPPGSTRFEPLAEGELLDADALCKRHGTAGAVIVDQPGVPEFIERVVADAAADPETAQELLRVALAGRALGVELGLRFRPISSLPVPAPAVIGRALDTVLPSGRTLLAVVWEGSEVWTALCLRRGSSGIDFVAGPGALLHWTGPLAGDYRRDHRAISRAVTRQLAPVHLGVFAQRDDLRRLLRDPSPGAWARAVTLREVLIEPSPVYATVAVGADAMRAAARYAGDRLGGIDLWSLVRPAARQARERVARVASVTELLGFNPLQTLAQKLRKIDSEAHEDQ